MRNEIETIFTETILLFRFRFVSVNFVSFRWISFRFRFVLVNFVSFRFGEYRFDFFRFVSFRFRFAFYRYPLKLTIHFYLFFIFLTCRCARHGVTAYMQLRLWWEFRAASNKSCDLSFQMNLSGINIFFESLKDS